MKSASVSELMTKAYRALDYQVVVFGDGSKGGLKFPLGKFSLITTFGELICDELGKEGEYPKGREA